MEILINGMKGRMDFSKTCLFFFLTIFAFLCAVIPAKAGPFGYGDGYEKYDRVHMSDPNYWASGFTDYFRGSNVDASFRIPEKALGKASGDTFDIVSLGRGGSIIVTFDYPIRNGEGWDFAVFENGFSNTFLELAYVEVSSDGNTFVRFDSCSLTPSPVNTYGTIDPTNITGLAGKYRKGYGTPFDLSDLVGKPEVSSHMVNLKCITHVRIIDIMGDGTCYDHRPESLKTRWGENAAIFDPYPTYQSAGFDLEAVGVRYQNTNPERANKPPIQPFLSYPSKGEEGLPLNPTLVTGPFFDPDRDQDIHTHTQWQISHDPNFFDSFLVLDLTSPIYLTALTMGLPILDSNTLYYWRARFYDACGETSLWSKPYHFKTIKIDDDKNGNGIPDSLEFEKGSNHDLDRDLIPDADQINGQYKCLYTMSEKGMLGIKVSSGHVEILSVASRDPNSIPLAFSRPDHLLLGLLSLTLKTEPYFDSNITLYFSEAMPDNAKWYIYDDLNNEWQDYSEEAYFDGNRTVMRLKFKDGGRGDLDGVPVPNGIIISQGGVGYFDDVVPPPHGEPGFGDMGACFIEASLQDENIEENIGEISCQRAKYKRIISLAPSITEVLFALGLEDHVVGVTNFCDYPEQAKFKEKVGGYYDTSYEAVLALEPDLVIMMPEHDTQKRCLEKLGIHILVVDQRDTQGILQSIRTIGAVCGRESKAAEIASDIHKRMHHIRDKTHGLSQPKVMICIGRTYGSGSLEDIYICGKKGFYNEMIMLAGGRNAYEGFDIRYPTVTGEGITSMNPEIIIEIIPDLHERGLSKEQIIRDWEQLKHVKAVKNRRIEVLGAGYVATPGPRFILVLEHIARVIHPEIDWQ